MFLAIISQAILKGNMKWTKMRVLPQKIAINHQHCISCAFFATSSVESNKTPAIALPKAKYMCLCNTVV